MIIPKSLDVVSWYIFSATIGATGNIVQRIATVTPQTYSPAVLYFVSKLNIPFYFCMADQTNTTCGTIIPNGFDRAADGSPCKLSASYTFSCSSSFEATSCLPGSGLLNGVCDFCSDSGTFAASPTLPCTSTIKNRTMKNSSA